MGMEVKMSNLAKILKNALSLDVHDRATLAERLLASLEELSDKSGASSADLRDADHIARSNAVR